MEIDSLPKKSNVAAENLKKGSYTDQDVKQIKDRFEKVTYNEISYKGVIKLLDSTDIDTINRYLDNYKKFKASKYNPTGFLIKAIMEGWSIPKEEVNNYHSKPIQSTNFQQRQYDDEYFESLYDNFKL